MLGFVSSLSVFDAFKPCWLKCLCRASSPLECSLLNLQCSSSTVSPSQRGLVLDLSIGCEKVLQLSSKWLHAYLCQALHLVSLEPATESHTSVSATMSYTECYNVCSENGTIQCALQGDRCICFDTYVRSSVDQRERESAVPCVLVTLLNLVAVRTCIHSI